MEKLADWKMLLPIQINRTFTLQIILLIANINDMWETINWKDQMSLSCALNERASEKAACICVIIPTRKSLKLYNEVAVSPFWLLLIVCMFVFKHELICMIRYLICASKLPKFGEIKTITLKKKNLKAQNSIWGRDVQHIIIHYRVDYLQPSLNVLNSLQSLIGILW